MSILLSIDPGVRACGCALWHEGKFLKAELVRCSTGLTYLVDVIGSTVAEVEMWPDVQVEVDEAVIERMQVYRGRAAKGDANDLLDVQLVVGALTGCFPKVHLVHPSEWKGQAPKAVTKARALDELTPEERTRVVLPRGEKAASNVWDSIGLGLRFLKDRGLR